jgi:hypothetical protein
MVALGVRWTGRQGGILAVAMQTGKIKIGQILMGINHSAVLEGLNP